MVEVMFPDIASHESTFKKILRMRVFELLVRIVCWKMYGIDTI